MNNKKIVKMDMKQYGMFFALIAIYVIFAILTKGANLSPMNINNLIMQNGYVVILAIGMLLCVLTGNIDLGVGSIVAVNVSELPLTISVAVLFNETPVTATGAMYSAYGEAV